MDVFTDEWGNVKERLSFDAFGERRSALGWQDSLSSGVLESISAATKRGYTGHEHVDHADIIHMNGRIYDSKLGRFVQADPVIQEVINSQNYNRYSYVLNNPLSYTDPTGYTHCGSRKGECDEPQPEPKPIESEGSQKSDSNQSKDFQGKSGTEQRKLENSAGNGESPNRDTPPPIDEELIKPPKPATLTLAFDGAGDTSLQGNKDFDDVVNSLNGDVEKFNSGVFDFPLPDATERALKFFRENLGGKLYLIGYSSGGADAIKLTNILADMGLPNVSGLVTIDPRSGHRLFVKSSRSIPNGIPAINFRQTKATPFGGSKLTYRKRYSGSGVRNIDLTGRATHNSIAGFVSRNYRDDVNRILQQGK